MTHDREALWEARLILRNAYTQLGNLRQKDPAIGVLRALLDAMCIGLTQTMEAMEPELILYPMEAV